MNTITKRIKRIVVVGLKVASFLVLILVLILVFVSIPVFHDKENQTLITNRMIPGIEVLHELIAYRKANGVWPDKYENYSKNGVAVLPDGEVNISVKIPNLLSGSEVGLIV